MADSATQLSAARRYWEHLEKLTLTVSGVGTGSGTINGTMAFDRKDYGMNKGIPFVTIANRVEVDVSLKGKRVSGPPLALKK